MIKIKNSITEQKKRSKKVIYKHNKYKSKKSISKLHSFKGGSNNLTFKEYMTDLGIKMNDFLSSDEEETKKEKMLILFKPIIDNDINKNFSNINLNNVNSSFINIENGLSIDGKELLNNDSLKQNNNLLYNLTELISSNRDTFNKNLKNLRNRNAEKTLNQHVQTTLKKYNKFNILTDSVHLTHSNLFYKYINLFIKLRYNNIMDVNLNFSYKGKYINWLTQPSKDKFNQQFKLDLGRQDFISKIVEEDEEKNILIKFNQDQIEQGSWVNEIENICHNCSQDFKANLKNINTEDNHITLAFKQLITQSLLGDIISNLVHTYESLFNLSHKVIYILNDTIYVITTILARFQPNYQNEVYLGYMYYYYESKTKQLKMKFVINDTFNEKLEIKQEYLDNDIKKSMINNMFLKI